MLQQFDAYISALVLEEARGGDPSAAEKRLDAFAEMPVLKVSDEAGNLAEILVGSGTIPEEHFEDALHIALATVNGMDMSARKLTRRSTWPSKATPFRACELVRYAHK